MIVSARIGRPGLADCRTREAHAECPFDPQKELRPPQAIDAEIPLQTARCGDVDDLRPLRVQLAHELAYDSNEFLLARSTITQRDNRAPLIRPCLHRSMMLTHSADTTLIRIKVLPIPPSEHIGMSCCACRQWPSGGLAAQAIHDADQLPLDQLMARMRDLVQRARAGRIRSSPIRQSLCQSLTNSSDGSASCGARRSPKGG